MNTGMGKMTIKKITLGVLASVLLAGTAFWFSLDKKILINLLQIQNS